MSREYREPPRVRDSPPEHRALLFAMLDLATDVNTMGQAAAAHIGINQTDLICLNTLFREGPLSAGQLAAAVGLTSGATTTAIDRLQRAGYVRRKSDPGDRRRVVVTASEEGALRAFAIFDGLMEALAGLSASYTGEQLALLRELIGDLRAIITAHAATLNDGPPAKGGSG